MGRRGGGDHDDAHVLRDDELGRFVELAGLAGEPVAPDERRRRLLRGAATLLGAEVISCWAVTAGESARLGEELSPLPSAARAVVLGRPGVARSVRTEPVVARPRGAVVAAWLDPVGGPRERALFRALAAAIARALTIDPPQPRARGRTGTLVDVAAGGMPVGDVELLARLADATRRRRGSPVVDAPDLPLVPGLTGREVDVARLVVAGRTVAEAAAALGLSDHTARQHLKRVHKKLGVRRRVELVRAWRGLDPGHGVDDADLSGSAPAIKTLPR